MRYILLLFLCFPAMSMAQKSKTDDTLILGNWDRDQLSHEDFFTHFEFSDDSNCIMNNHYGNVYAMSYGQKQAKWSVSKHSILINPLNAEGENDSYTLIYKIVEEKNIDAQNSNSHILRLEVKNLKTGKKYFFYKIAA